jgi:acyl carrier protein
LPVCFDCSCDPDFTAAIRPEGRSESLSPLTAARGFGVDFPRESLVSDNGVNQDLHRMTQKNVGDRLVCAPRMNVLSTMQSHIKEFFHVDLHETVLARIESGELTEDMELSSVLDSLDTVHLTMEIEELGIEPTVRIKTVGDLLWLLNAIELRRKHQ